MRNQYLVLVKGTDALAAEEARRRGCTVIRTLARNSDYASLLVSVPSGGMLSDWYLSSTQAPFPDGELMHYREADRHEDHGTHAS